MTREALINRSLGGEVVDSRPRRASAAALVVRRSESDAGTGFTAKPSRPVDQCFPRQRIGSSTRPRSTTRLLTAAVVATSCALIAACGSAPEDANAQLAASKSLQATAPPSGPQTDAPASPQPTAAVPSAQPEVDASAQASADAQARVQALIASNQAAQLPGGGRAIFTATNAPADTKVTKMYVALYGHPSGPALGLLGEQGTQATIARAKKYAASYEPYTKRAVIPALEIIATVASAGAGKDGDYSSETEISDLRPLVDAAKEAGVYVVLDLQPGRTDFLTQAKRYVPLLREPHVGLALDPEWRLKANQKHLRQIGSVSVAEVNRVSAWLDAFTAQWGLPQKMLLLHQFRLSMIRNREDLNTQHANLSFVIQMDGQGGQSAKQETWAALRMDAPANVRFGWKNFIDEDSPMLTPAQTMTQVKPKPVWVSYQ